MEHLPMRHYQSAGWNPAIESTDGQEYILPTIQTPSFVPRSLPISVAYGTFPGSLRSHLNALPRRPTWLERLIRTTGWKDVKKYTIAIILIICILAACWYGVSLIWSVVQTSIAIGRDVYNWLAEIPTTIGGAITRWVEALKNSFGGSLTAMWTT